MAGIVFVSAPPKVKQAVRFLTINGFIIDSHSDKCGHRYRESLVKPVFLVALFLKEIGGYMNELEAII